MEPRNLPMIKRKITSLRKLRALGEKCRLEKKKVVFTAGAFDLIHIGQVRYLAKAKSLGDVLVVGVASDASQRELKGSPFPIMDEKIRAEMVAYLKPVDFVVASVNKQDLRRPLKSLRPRVFFTTSEGWKRGMRSEKEARIVKKLGGRIVKIPYIKPYLSTADIAKKVAFIRIQQIAGQLLGDRELGPIYEEK